LITTDPLKSYFLKKVVKRSTGTKTIFATVLPSTGSLASFAEMGVMTVGDIF